MPVILMCGPQQENQNMSKYSKSIYSLLAAFSFYFTFGYFFPEVIGVPRAAQSISPAMTTIVVIITIGLLILSVIEFLKARTD